MFFAIDLLIPQHKGKFAVAWIAATRGVFFLSRKKTLNCVVVRLCDDILEMVISTSSEGRRRLSLALSARLINGTIKIHQQQINILLEQIVKFLATIRIPPGFEDKKRKRRTSRTSRVRPKRRPPVPVDTPTITIVDNVPGSLPVEDTFGILPEDDPFAMIHNTLPFNTSQNDLPRREPSVPTRNNTIIVTADVHRPMDDFDDTSISRPLTKISIPRQPIDEIGVISSMNVDEIYEMHAVPEMSTVVEPEREPGTSTIVERVPPTVSETPVIVESVPPIEPGTLAIVELVLPTEPETPAVPKPRRKPLVMVKTRHPRRMNIFREPLTCAEIDEFMREPLPQFTKDHILPLVRNLIGNEEFESAEAVYRRYMDLLKKPARTSLPKRRDESVPPMAPPAPGDMPKPQSDIVDQSVMVQSAAVDAPMPQLDIVDQSVPPQTTLPENIIPDEQILYTPSKPTLLKMPSSDFFIQDITVQIATPAIEAQFNDAPKRAPVIVEADQVNHNLLDSEERLKEIIRQWDHSVGGKIEIKDICDRPVNRYNIALTFRALINLQMKGYVLMRTKPDSIELDCIEKGPRL